MPQGRPCACRAEIGLYQRAICPGPDLAESRKVRPGPPPTKGGSNARPQRGEFMPSLDPFPKVFTILAGVMRICDKFKLRHHLCRGDLVEAQEPLP